MEAGGKNSKPKVERLLRNLVQLPMSNPELHHLLANRFDLEIVQTPVVNADVLIPEGKTVKLGFRLRLAGWGIGIREVRMRVEHVQFLKLLDPSQDAVKRSAQKYSQLHVTCITYITMRLKTQNSNRVSAGFTRI